MGNDKSIDLGKLLHLNSEIEAGRVSIVGHRFNELDVLEWEQSDTYKIARITEGIVAARDNGSISADAAEDLLNILK